MRGKATEPCPPTLDQRADPRGFHALPERICPCAIDQRRKVEPDRLGGLAPLFAEGRAVLDFLLARAGIERSDAAGFEARTAPRLEHFLAACRKRHDLLARNPARLEIAVLEHRTRLVAKLFDGDAKARHCYRVERGIELPQAIVLERSPLAVLPLRDVGDDRVEVEIGLLVAVGVMLEQADSEIACRLSDHLALLDYPGLGRVLFGPLQRLDDGFAVGSDDPFVLPDKRQKRPALGHREGEIGPGPVRLSGIADAAAVGQLAAQQRVERLSLDLALKT